MEQELVSLGEVQKLLHHTPELYEQFLQFKEAGNMEGRHYRILRAAIDSGTMVQYDSGDILEDNVYGLARYRSKMKTTVPAALKIPKIGPVRPPRSIIPDNCTSIVLVRNPSDLRVLWHELAHIRFFVVLDKHHDKILKKMRRYVLNGDTMHLSPYNYLSEVYARRSETGEFTTYQVLELYVSYAFTRDIAIWQYQHETDFRVFPYLLGRRLPESYSLRSELGKDPLEVVLLVMKVILVFTFVFSLAYTLLHLAWR